LSRLQELTRLLLDTGSEFHTLRPEVLELTAILTDAQTTGIKRRELIAEGETLTPDGLALSPTNAMMCADDYVRTVKFIRGIHAAIVDRQKLHPDRPVRVLYAGCGPYAILAVPVMSLMPFAEVTFTLVDIHAESIEAARSIVETLGYEGSVSAYEIVDAGSYRIPEDLQPDIILMEIMQACLKSEPQVALARHLLRQAPDAVLVPEEVRIELTLVDLSHEFTLIGDEQDVPELQRDRIHVGTLFTLSRETMASWNPSLTDRLPAAKVHVPTLPEPRYELKLFTIIHVYGGNVLKDYDCSLTGPRSVGQDMGFKLGDIVQFHYRLGSHPGLTCRVLAACRT
jgi:hypothetical protein